MGILKRAARFLMGRGDFSVTFWGVRGSIGCGGSDYARYGGNTSCLEVRCNGRTLIFDAGTGLRPLGDALLARTQGPLDIDIYLTHTHFDHICGLPFFAPFYLQQNRFRVWAGHLAPLTTRDAVATLMSAPIFPVNPEIFKAAVAYCDYTGGATLTPFDGVALKTAPLNHPNGATGYRIEYGGRSICYITDMEHPDKGVDERVRQLIAGCDVFIYDASYTDEEYPEKKGYGHSTWRAGLELAVRAGVKQYVLFHHDPAHTDEKMDAIMREAEAAGRERGIKTLAAREGLTIAP